MVNGDAFTSPIDFALQETMKQFENSEDTNDKLIYGLLQRSRAMWENIRIYSIEICGMTYEQFCEQLANKKNVIFLSDDEKEDFNKAVDIMSIMRR